MEKLIGFYDSNCPAWEKAIRECERPSAHTVTLYRCFTLRRTAAPHALYSLSRALRPQIVCSDWLRFEGRTGEKTNLWKIATLVVLGRAFGLRRTVGGGPGSYGYEVVRIYEESDFAACQLLLFGGHATKRQVKDARNAQGRLMLNTDFMHGLRLGNAWTRIVVSDDVRRILEGAGLVGLQFQEAVPRDRDAPACADRFWELQSSVVLPKMSNTHQLKYTGMHGAPHQPFDGDYSRMVFLDDPPYRSGEIHYRRSDLAQFDRFDVANTFELYRQPHRVLVISQRFYQTCHAHCIDLWLEPVRLDLE